MGVDLEKLERLAAQATPGPWEVVASDKYTFTVAILPPDFPQTQLVGRIRDEQDAAYIVAACNAVPELIAENRALQEQVRELEREREWLASQHAKACLDAANDACTLNTGDCPVCPLDKGGRCLEVTSKTFIEAAEKAAKEAWE
jgi:hypothetical protein